MPTIRTIALSFLALAAATLHAETRPRGAASWIDARQVGPFAVRATFPLAGFEATLAELPELEREVRRVLAVRPCEAPLEVLLFADDQEYHAYLDRHFPQAPRRQALFVKRGDRSTVLAYRGPELAIDLRHECTHALLHADLPMLPLWLDEGLAEYFEVRQADRATRNPNADALKWNMRLGVVRSLEALESKHELEELTARDYQYAWAWTHYLLHGPKSATEQLWGFLAAIRRGEPPGKMSDRLAAATPGGNRRLVRHFRAWVGITR